jgi:hypothetical protein
MLQAFVPMFVGMGYFAAVFSVSWFVSAGMLVIVMQIVQMLVFMLGFFMNVGMFMPLADVQVNTNAH